jgi:hypothetical protein
MSETFIQKSKNIHGNKYDYSRVDYVKNHQKVIIICKKHGEFEQTPNNHLSGYGCKKCAGTAKLSTNEFIIRSKTIHGDLFDYSKVNYINSTTKVIIICKEHGEYQQTPKLHINGAGCGKCAGTAKSTTKDFIEKSKSIHNDLYDYSKVNYINSKTEITIICKTHGEFKQAPKCHLKGHGCIKCSIVNTSNSHKTPVEEFITRSQEKHGIVYDYSKVNYINSETKIIIVCKEHGEFYQTPYVHLHSKGCQKCSGHYTLTNEEFVDKAKQIHGDIYDYSKVDYKTSNKEVIIICKTHGEFLQKPVIHYWNKAGCPKCANKNVTTYEFIEKAIKIHGDKYDYSKVIYKNSNENVIIICKEHGYFLQKPNNHLNSAGCQKCNNSYTLTTEEFIEKSKLIHKNRYDYSKINYKNTDTKVTIICKEHGEFQQTSAEHYNGSGCPKCYYKTISDRQLLSQKECIQRFRNTFGNRFNYDKVEYKGSTKHVIITCYKHGDFQQMPISHWQGNGCIKCSGLVQLTTIEFIERSKKIHGDTYDYSKSIYISNSKKVIIICKKHGEFQQNPSNHYRAGNGCPMCVIQISKPQIIWLNFLSKLYNINIQHGNNGGEFLIPNTKYKADGYCLENNTIYEFHGDFWHGNPKKYDRQLINKRTNCTFGELYNKTQQKELKIKSLGYKLEIIWESDWYKINKNIKKFQLHFLKKKGFV